MYWIECCSLFGGHSLIRVEGYLESSLSGPVVFILKQRSTKRAPQNRVGSIPNSFPLQKLSSLVLHCLDRHLNDLPMVERAALSKWLTIVSQPLAQRPSGS